MLGHSSVRRAVLRALAASISRFMIAGLPFLGAGRRHIVGRAPTAVFENRSRVPRHGLNTQGRHGCQGLVPWWSTLAATMDARKSADIGLLPVNGYLKTKAFCTCKRKSHNLGLLAVVEFSAIFALMADTRTANVLR